MENTEILKEIVSKLVGDVETYIPDEICPNDKTKEKLRQYVTNPQFTMDCSDEYDESMNEGYFTLNGLYTARKIVIETLIQHDIMLDEFVKCPSSYIRSLVAKNSWYGLDVLVDDNDERVRIEVARHGYGLEKLVNDESWYVRKEVARQGYGLEKLVNDESWYVRKEVARHGYGLDRLIDDDNITVRTEVASRYTGSPVDEEPF